LPGGKVARDGPRFQALSYAGHIYALNLSAGGRKVARAHDGASVRQRRRTAGVAFIAAPDGFRDTLGELPDGVRVLFVMRRAELERRFDRLRVAMDPAAGLWAAWPKRASGVETD
jgi:hypothetical protein